MWNDSWWWSYFSSLVIVGVSVVRPAVVSVRKESPQKFRESPLNPTSALLPPPAPPHLPPLPPLRGEQKKADEEEGEEFGQSNPLTHHMLSHGLSCWQPSAPTAARRSGQGQGRSAPVARPPSPLPPHCPPSNPPPPKSGGSGSVGQRRSACLLPAPTKPVSHVSATSPPGTCVSTTRICLSGIW